MAYQTENEAFYTDSANATPTDAITYAVTDGVKTYTLTKDVTLSNLTYNNTDEHCITLAAGEVFDGGRYTIYILGSDLPGLFDISNNTNPDIANRSFNDTYRCTIKNLTIDMSSNSTVSSYQGGYIQKGHSTEGSSSIGVLIQNCISKRALRGSAQDECGGFIGARDGASYHNVTLENCLFVYPEDFGESSNLVHGGFASTDFGREITTACNCVQHFDISGCISYVSLTTTSIGIETQTAPATFSKIGAFFGKRLGGPTTTNTSDALPTVTNCYFLAKIVNTYYPCKINHTSYALNSGVNFMQDLSGVLDPVPSGWSSFGWRGKDSTTSYTLTPTDGSPVLNTAFQSTPWDSDEYTAIGALPVLLTPGSSGSSGGDPYVYPIKSNIPVKLPNTKAVYRMFEQGNTFINAQVDKASPEHMLRMIKYAEKLTPVTHNIITDGFFYSKFFIHSEGHEMVIDLVSKKITATEEGNKFFNTKYLKTCFDDGEFNEDALTYRIKWTIKNYGRVAIDVLFFPNPHIENGIRIRAGSLKNATGMLVDNYKPKLMRLPSVSTLKYEKIQRRLNNTENVFQKKAIKGKNEKWHSKK